MVTKDEILKVSKIAQIFINEEEAQTFTESINDVLKFVNMMDEVALEDEPFVN